MRVHVAHDKHGRIIAAAETGKGGGDILVARPGATVAELELPEKFADVKLSESLHLLRVDTKSKRLVEL